MTRVRKPAVAGTFYPEDPQVLRSLVEGLLAAVPERGPAPKAIIAPHAGYAYSGSVAASAYARLREARGRVRRVVLLGPAHRFALRGFAAHDADAFRTPLGLVPVEQPPVPAGVPVIDAAHAGEHCLEVQLPFLQVVLGDFRAVPVVVGEARPDEVAHVIEALWGGDETVVVVSSDLSHYLDDVAARRRDRATADAIVALDAARLRADDACGRRPVAGLLVTLRRHGLCLECVDLRTSADTAGDPSSVVGYGAFVTV